MAKIIEKFEFSNATDVKEFTLALDGNQFFWDNYHNLVARPVTTREFAVEVEFNLEDSFEVKLAAIRLMAEAYSGNYSL